jgi:hypothetical protein
LLGRDGHKRLGAAAFMILPGVPSQPRVEPVNAAIEGRAIMIPG